VYIKCNKVVSGLNSHYNPTQANFLSTGHDVNLYYGLQSLCFAISQNYAAQLTAKKGVGMVSRYLELILGLWKSLVEIMYLSGVDNLFVNSKRRKRIDSPIFQIFLFA